MGGISSERSDRASNSLHVPKLSCKYDRPLVLLSPLQDPIYSNLIPHPSRVKYKYKCQWRFRRNITVSYWENRAVI